MAGRKDYQERREARIDRLNAASEKAATQSAAEAMDRAIEQDKKADYYASRAEAAENNTAISSDDPDAIAKLTAKIEKLEAERERIKAYNEVLNIAKRLCGVE